VNPISDQRPFPAYRGDEPYVFVCYAHEDAETVYPELAELHRQGLRMWYDEGISAGRNWRAEIGTALLGAERVLFYVSPAALASDHCNREMNLALDEGKEIVPVYLENVELTPDLKIGLTRLQALRRDSSDYLKRLLQALQPGRPASDVAAPVAADVRRRPRNLVLGSLALAVVLLAGAGSLLLFRDAAPDVETVTPEADRPPTVSVAAFSAVGADPRLAPFASAVTDDVRRLLTQSSLRVVSASQSETADYLVSGRIRSGPQVVRLTVELISREGGEVLWSNPVEEDVRALDAVQLERSPFLAQMIERVINIDRTRSQWEQAGLGTEATNLYRSAIVEQSEIEYRMGGDWRLVAQQLERVLELEPDFVPALATLSGIYAGRLGSTISASEARPKAHEYVRRLLAQEPDFTFTLGVINLYLDLDYPAARANFEYVRQYFPVGELEDHLCLMAFAQGQLSRAADHCSSAVAAAPTPQALRDQGMILLNSGRFADAVKALDASLRSGGPVPDAVTLFMKSWAEALAGNPAAATATLDDALDRYRERWPELYVVPLAVLGRTDQAHELIDEALRREQAGTAVYAHHGPLFLGYYYLGDLDSAFDRLERAVENREVLIVGTLRSSPLIESLRADPRFAAVMRHLEAIEAEGTPTPSVATSTTTPERSS